MVELHLNKAHKFFYFQTRIHGYFLTINKDVRRTVVTTSEWPGVWKLVLDVITELKVESGVEIYGLVLDQGQLKVVFSTPYFNENILVLDWELRIRKRALYCFDRPILCEPISTEENVKKVLIEMYKNQIEIQKIGYRWVHPFSSLRLLIEGSAQARLFKDPLKIVFKPELILRFGRRAESDLSVENQGIDRRL